MKKILVLVIGLSLLLFGCIQEEPPAPKDVDSTMIGDDAVWCIHNVAKEVGGEEQIKDSKGYFSVIKDPYTYELGSLIRYPVDEPELTDNVELIDTEECNAVWEEYNDKVVIGQVVEVGGCNSFSGEVLVEKDDETKTIKVTFVVNGAPPEAVCTMDIQYRDVWVALDYVGGYSYESEVVVTA